MASVAPPPAPAPIPAAPASTITLTPEQRQAAIDAETDRLQEWSMNDDPAFLSNILADLNNSEKEIRDRSRRGGQAVWQHQRHPHLESRGREHD